MVRIIPFDNSLSVREIDTLKDVFGRELTDLRISVIDKCNFRCPYCMPTEVYDNNFPFLTNDQRLSFDEILRLVRLFSLLGVTKVRLTGGEPLLRKNLPELIREISKVEGINDIALTTNGFLLKQHASALKLAGLNRVTVSLDSLDEKTFAQMSGGRGDLKTVLNGINEALAVGLTPLKVNTVVQKGVNDQSYIDILEYFRESNVVVRLIEFMDVGTVNKWAVDKTVPSARLIQEIEARWPLQKLRAAHSADVARRYSYQDDQGEIGFISSVSEPFCGDCSRARISSNGNLHTCLFSNQGTSLQTLLRQGAADKEIMETIISSWQQRNDQYSETRNANYIDRTTIDRIEMFHIGG